MKKYAVIVAGGAGTRMQSNVPKQFMELNGKPVLWHTLQAFLHAYHDLHIILVLKPGFAGEGQHIVSQTGQANRISMAPGGETRFHSVKNGLGKVPDDSIVFVHDAVRCLVSTALIQRCYEQAMQHGNAVPAIHATDTIRIDSGQGPMQVDRNKVYIIQTPQTFQSKTLKAAFEQPYTDSFTDEASVAEAAGITIHLIEGDPANIKLTRPIDVKMAEALLGSEK